MKYTSGRLVATILLAATAWLTSQVIRVAMPPDTQFGMFDQVNVLIGGAVGWMFVGARLQRGLANALGIGLTAAVVLLFWGLMVQAFMGMFAQANRRQYDGPMEAAVGVFEIGFDLFLSIANTPVLTTLVLGSVISVLVAERAARNWR